MSETIERMEKHFLPQIRAGNKTLKRQSAPTTPHEEIAEWFETLSVPKQNLKLKYRSNDRYQNACDKIDKIENELEEFEDRYALNNAKSRNSDSTNSPENGRSHWESSSKNCEHDQQTMRTKLEERNELITEIFKILPEVRQRAQE